MMSLAATATVILMLVLLSGLFIVISGLNGLAFIESSGGHRPAGRWPVETQRDALIAYVEEQPGVKGVTYVSPEMAMQRLQEAYRERGARPGRAEISLYSSLEIALDDPNFVRWPSAAGPPRGGSDHDQQADYETLLDIIGTIRMVGVVALVLVGAVVLFMIVNTIRIAVYSRQRDRDHAAGRRQRLLHPLAVHP